MVTRGEGCHASHQPSFANILRNEESTHKTSYIVYDCHINAGFKQQLGDLLLLQSRRNVQRRITVLQFIQSSSASIYPSIFISVLTAIFPGESELAGYIGAKDNGSAGDN